MDAAVLIPIKAFHQAKGRLAPVLSSSDRERLARWTAGRVIVAAGELPTYIACDDERVAEFSRSRGATVIWGERLGLNGAVNDAVGVLSRAGHDHVLVVHGDLPRPPSLAPFARTGAIGLVPDLRLDGTNLISFPTDSGLEVAFGAGSFRRHLTNALELPRRVWVARDRFLALDIDHPSDLDHPLVKEALPPWLQTTPDNPHRRT